MRFARSPRSAAASSPRKCAPAGCWRCRAASTSIGSSYNRATQALRQPGSAFKPIVYVTALENGMTPASIIVDAPFCVWQGAGLGNKCFRNFDGRYAGPKTMRWGVEQSRNLMTVRAASQTGMAKVVANAAKLGVGNYDRYLSIALGAGDTTVLKLTNAYAMLANHGRAVRPTIIDYVQDRNGKVIYPHRQSLPGDGGKWRAATRPTGTARRCRARRSRQRQLLDAAGRLSDGPHPGRRGRARHRDRAARPRPADVRQDRHDLRPDQRLVRRRHAGRRRRRLSRLRPAAADGPWRPGRADRRAGVQAIRPGRLQGHAQDPVRRAGRHPHGADRPGQRQARVRHLPDHGRSQIVGHLGSVPARDRAAPLVPPRASSWPRRRIEAAERQRRRARPERRAAPAPAARPADSGEFLQRQGGIY